VRIWSLIIAAGAAGVVASACGSNSSAGTAGAGGGRGRGRGNAAAAPIVSAKVTEKDVPVDIAAIGNVEAYASISVRAQITGLLTEISFREGDSVKAGQQLFTIDRRPFEAALAQANAMQERNKALLAQAEAQLARDAASAEYAQISAERQSQLNQRGIISKDAAEQMRAGADAANALVKADKASIESARAQVVAQDAAIDAAKVSLDFTKITSPIDGRTGTLSVKVGSLITQNQTELTTIARVRPVFVTFSVPAVHLSTIKSHMAPGQELPVTATAQDTGAQPTNGLLTFVDNAVDTTTDTIKLKATFQNDDYKLWPGQFARVSLRLAVLNHAIVVPSQAVQTGQDGQYVFVVKADSTVEQRPVTPGQRVADDVVIDNGLKVGETVVTEGQLRLEPGSAVTTDAGGRGGRGRGRGPGGAQGAQGGQSGAAQGSGAGRQ
jgi:multidrug efflux system membrane fusion protein